MANAVDIDAREVLELMKQLDEKQLRKASKAAFRAAAKVIRDAAVANYKKEFPGSERWRAIIAPPFKAGDGAYVKGQSFKKLGLRRLLTVVRSVEKAGGTVKGAKAATYGAFVLPILEGGTAARASSGRSKSGSKYNRGAVTARWFFRDAKQSALPKAERKFLQSLEKFFKKNGLK